MIAAVSTAPFISSMARALSPICESAKRCAAVWSFVAAVYFSIPSRPRFVMMSAARLASDPKIVCMAASFSALERSPSLSVSSCATPAASSMFPLPSRTLIPRDSIFPAASSVGAARRWSMVLSDVPASLPVTPASAKAPRTAVVSWMLHPALFACAETCDNPCVRSDTSAEEAAAAPARAFAASPVWSAERPNAPIA